MFKNVLLSIVAIIGSFIIPLLFNPVLDLIEWFTSVLQNEKVKEFLQYFAIDKSTYLSILSIEASTLVAIAVYWMQKRGEKLKEMEQKMQAKNSLFSTLVASLKEVYDLSRLDLYEDQEYRFIRISEKHFEALTEIDGLTDEDIRLLNNVLKELECLVEYEKEGEVGEIRIHMEKLISNIMIPPYVQYKYIVAEPNDAFEVMNEHMLSILRKFDYTPGSEGKSKYFSKSGDIIIEYDKAGKAMVYDKAGEKICHAFVDNKGIREGWARLYQDNKILYEGEWKNYKKHGQGIEYLKDYGNSQYVSKEGIWKNGELWDGKIYDVLVYSDGRFLDDLIIQINSQFYMNEAQWIKDYTGYGVVNLIVKEGKLKIDSTEPIREVKQTYESKYGVVEWEDYNFSQKEDEIPEIHIEINETNELELVFNPALKIDTLSIPKEVKIDEIPTHLRKYVTDEEIEAYNAKLPLMIEKVKAYNNELEIYEYAQAFGVEINLSVINKGSRKANDIHIDLSFPDELIIIAGSKENLEEPEIPSLPSNPIDKAWSKLMRTDLLSAMRPVWAFSHGYSPKNAKLWDVASLNRDNWTGLNGNTISLYCAELLHTTQKEFKDRYLLVPTKVGIFDVNISIICEEYIERDEFTIQVNVKKNDRK